MFIVYVLVYEFVGVNDDLVLYIDEPKRVYTWYTYSLIHYNIIHICINIAALIAYGTILEIKNGTWRTALIHSIAIIGGAFGVGWEARNHNVLGIVGTSGGNYGLLGAQVGNLVMNWNELAFAKWFYLALMLTVLSVDFSMTAYVLMKTDAPISISNHLGGLGYGMLAGTILVENSIPERWEKICKYVVGSLLTVLTVASSANLLTV